MSVDSEIIHSCPTEFAVAGGSTFVNTDLDRFCLTRSLDESDLSELFDKYEFRMLNVFWHAAMSPKKASGLPPAFDVFKPSKGRALTFKHFRVSTIAERLKSDEISHSPLSNATDIRAALEKLDDRQLAGFLQILKPSNTIEASEILTKRSIKRIFSFSPRDLFESLLEQGVCAGTDQFLEWICTIRNHKTIKRTSYTHIWRLLSVANDLGLLLFPFAVFQNSLRQRRATRGTRGGGQKYLSALTDRFLHSESRGLLLSEFCALLPDQSNKRSRQIRLFGILLHTMNAHSRADIPPEALLHFRDEFQKSDAFRTMKLATKLETMRYIKNTYNAIDRLLTPHDSGPRRKLGPLAAGSSTGPVTRGDAKDLSKSSGAFTWMTTQEPRLAVWAQFFRNYVSAKPVISKTSLVILLNVFCDYLILVRPMILSPEEVTRSCIRRRDNTNQKDTIIEYLTTRYGLDSPSPSRVMGVIRDFFNWYIAEFDSSFPQPVFDLDIPMAPAYQGKTNKIALPARLLAMMRDVITENDFYWPKTIREDYFMGHWCPVRATAMSLLLTVPLRTIQVRQLDSGEGDEFRIDLSTGDSIRNSCGEKGRNYGVLRKINDTGLGKSFIGLFVNTNKTSAPSKQGRNAGYEIPWENSTLNSQLELTIQWQESQNPVSGPRHVNDCIDRGLHCSDALADLVPPRYFLFRDPCTSDPAEPVTRVRLESFYLMLLAECERRLAEIGDPITLITKWKPLRCGKKPDKAITSLHGLRVSGITAFAEAGIPLQILTEFLAGHSTILMNLHYQKFGPATITEIISKASCAWENASDHESFGRFVEDNISSFLSELENNVDRPINPLASAFVYDGIDSIRNIARHEPAFWHVGLDGICPNGGTMCDTGGPLTGTSGGIRTSPVEGGAGNCPRCRYWVTGPVFLFGQLISANALLYQLHENSVALSELEDHLCDLQEDRRTNKHTLHKARVAIDSMNARIENDLHTWVKRYQYVSQSISILQDTESTVDAKFPIIANETDLPKLTLSETHQFDLLEFVAQSCEVFPAIDSGTAILKKSKAVDALLDRNNLKPFLFGLSDEMALKAGNQLTNFLESQLPHENVLALFDGKATFESLGISNDSLGAILENGDRKYLQSASVDLTVANNGDLEVDAREDH